MIAGKGPLLSKIKDFAKTMRKVIVTGPVPEHEKIFYLSAADIFVLPSFVEGIPLSLLEAGAIGLPAIASRVGGIPEIIQDNYNGFLFRAGDVCDLREKLLHLLSNSSLREFLGKNARKNIERNFGIHVYDKYIKVYDSLV
jgi:glycosyltransferase involved in cell wall biosynthesis